MSFQQNAYVLGVGLTQFIKPRQLRPYPELGFEAGTKALLDAHITYDDVQTGVACYCYGDTTSGQRIFYQFGMTNIPIYNTNNACATGSTGLQMARTLVKGGIVDVVMVIGFETMKPGSIKSIWDDRPSPMGLGTRLMEETRGKYDSPRNAQFFANAGREYMEKYGATARDFAEIARISHEHSSRNPYAQFRDVYTLEQIEKSPMIHYPLTKLQCSPTSDGAGAAVIVSQRFLDSRPELKSHAVLMAGQSLMTDSPALFSRSAMDLVGFDMTRRAAKAALAEAGVAATDVKVCEMHDCFSANELITLEGLGFCEPGKAHLMVRNGDITYGGKGPIINPSGGLISKGHPLGATGLAQCAELTWQLRGWANNGRLVKDVDVALQHNLGLGGAVVITVYKRGDGRKNTDVALGDAEIAELSGVGYNPAVEARGVTKEDFEKIRSKSGRSDYALGETAEKIQARL
ncbi:acetyl-CoA acyltransferase [Cladophialophora yegresii CBS 114405]|uniref:propanoyl-CoA C-acyltransferase n=1 Tax=Cladophialophora yegresii CBS 114405 TaxID=1182544 RepID=W9W3B1_9EURO|nr:acetyl-CoA acyltransferase [Cladophialophora yegresii CBS 114405]EXJ59026.1 acetyl-CoA acyltransferase [Cladophialophora yegresii CBS 114405]